LTFAIYFLEYCFNFNFLEKLLRFFLANEVRIGRDLISVPVRNLGDVAARQSAEQTRTDWHKRLMMISTVVVL
jgi:hypothetical protein